jgi:hypothetical protein
MASQSDTLGSPWPPVAIRPCTSLKEDVISAKDHIDVEILDMTHMRHPLWAETASFSGKHDF